MRRAVEGWVARRPAGPASSGYSVGATLGFLSPVPAPGTAALYSCLSGSDHFLSLSASCEGDTVLGNEGYIYASAPTGGASSLLYSCLAATTASHDYFAATSYDGATTVGPLQNSDQFLSKDPGCEGQTNLGLEGRIYVDPPPGLASVAVYRRSVPGSDHFAADDPGFEWRWACRHTRLIKVQITHLSRRATIPVACHGRGSGCQRRPLAAVPRTVRRLIRSLQGRTYLPGDQITVSVTARGYQSIRARITVRNNPIPIVRTL